MTIWNREELQQNLSDALTAAENNPVFVRGENGIQAVILSMDALKRLTERANQNVDRKSVDALTKESMERYGNVYEVLARYEQEVDNKQ